MAEVSIFDGKLYSTDMMIAYTNIFKPPIIQINVQDYEKSLYNKIWWSFTENKHISAMDVIENPDKDEDHRVQYRDMQIAELKCPILLDEDGNIINGYHRLSKAYIQHKKKISAVIMTNDIINKCKLSDMDQRDEQIKYITLSPFKYIELFIERFYE
jgi:hypothetical protein